MNFMRYLRGLFYRTPPGNCVCNTEKSSINKIVKSRLKKIENWKLLVRKTATLFSLLPMTHSKRVFLETMQSEWGFIYHRTLFITYANLTLILVNTKIFAKTNNKRNRIGKLFWKKFLKKSFSFIIITGYIKNDCNNKFRD